MSASIVDRETGYLLACLAHGLDSTRPWPHPPQGLDWKRMLVLITENRLTGLIHALGKSQSSSWPEEFSESLRIERYRWMVHGEQSRARVHSALTALKSAGVNVIVLKGWANISRIYGDDASQRLCEDVDLLVHPRQADAAEDVLHSLGCTLKPESWPGYHRRYDNGGLFFFAKDPRAERDAFAVGLHWGLFHVPCYDPARVDMESLFARARHLKVAGVDALELSPVDSLVYACAHLSLHHRFDPALFRYFEIASLIPGMDWDAVAQRASEWQTLLPTQDVIAHVSRLWPDLLPASTLDTLRHPKPSRLERFVDGWLNWTRGRPAFTHLLLWSTFPELKQRPLIFLQDIFPGPEYLRKRYGSPPLGFWPFLYLRRFARGIASLWGGRDA